MESTKVWAPHSLHRIPLAGPNWRPDGKRVTTDRAQQVQPLRAQNMKEKGEEERIQEVARKDTQLGRLMALSGDKFIAVGKKVCLS